MSKMVVIDGDELIFDSQFGPNMVIPLPPLQISGSGEVSIEAIKLCIVGDEKQVSISANYTKPPYIKPGTGTITITGLATDQMAEFAMAQRPIIVVGSQFTAQFQPTSPAMDPQGNPDTDLSPAPGTGRFINRQSFVSAG